MSAILMSKIRALRLLALPLVIGAVGISCSPGADEQGTSSATTATSPGPTLAVALEIGVPNARMPQPRLLTGGQPTEAQLEALADAGYKRFISLRPAAEDGAGWEEQDASEYDFDRLAIAGAADLTRENVEAFAALMAEAGDEPTVVYCASGNRAGAMLALKAYWLDGASAEDALQLGLDAGMTRLSTPVSEILGLQGGP